MSLKINEEEHGEEEEVNSQSNGNLLSIFLIFRHYSLFIFIPFDQLANCKFAVGLQFSVEFLANLKLPTAFFLFLVI